MIHGRITAAPAIAALSFAAARTDAGRFHFDRWDKRNPSAPPVWRCWSCDGYMHGQTGFCADCDAETTCWLDQAGCRL